VIKINEIERYIQSRPVLTGMGIAGTIGAFLGGPLGAFFGGVIGGLLGLSFGNKNN
jgi:outer membrane lipoprotein SlyB